MNIPIDEVIYFDCITTHPSTGAATDADSTPTFAVYEESTDTDIGVGGNLTKRTSLTGNYRGTFTLSAANGFEAGKWYSIIGSATVNSIAGKAVIKNFRCVVAEATAGILDVNAKNIGNTAQTGRDIGASVLVGDKTGFSLTSAYDPAKTAAQAGDAMTLTTGERTSVGTAVWASTTRTLSSFGTLVADTATAVWDKATSALTTSGSIGKYLLDKVDVVLSTRSSHSAADVWAVGTRTLTSFGTLVADVATAIWDKATSALTTVGSIGKLLVDNVNATIGSRSSHSAADVWAVGTRTLTSFGTLVSDVAAAVWDKATSALTTAGSIGKRLVDFVTTLVYSAPPTASAITDAVWDENIDPDHVIPGSFGERINQNLDAQISGISAELISDAVWDEDIADHLSAGTTGEKLNAAEPQSADDITETLLKLDLSTVTGEADRSVLNALRFLRNKWTLTGNTLSVKKEDDTTEAWTAEVSTDPAAEPITGSDPA